MTELKFITIELKIEDDPSLIILLHEDGTINRKGNGTSKIDHNFFMGITDTKKIILELAQSINSDFEQFLNKVYDIPEKSGKNCSLEIVLSAEAETKGVRFIYGSESMGPPLPVKNFVLRAIQLTDPWFKQQQKNVNRGEKKWWQFWK